jgi:hypothetical protein
MQSAAVCILSSIGFELWVLCTPLGMVMMVQIYKLTKEVDWMSRNEEALANTQCPQQVELRWQTEVSSSIYATPLITDINTYTP